MLWRENQKEEVYGILGIPDILDLLVVCGLRRNRVVYTVPSQSLPKARHPNGLASHHKTGLLTILIRDKRPFAQ
jgi:hypothetical protein